MQAIDDMILEGKEAGRQAGLGSRKKFCKFIDSETNAG